MRSKNVDVAVPKLALEVAASGGQVPTAAITVSMLNFKLDKSGLFRITHLINCNHDSSATLAGLNRQIYINGTGIYGQVEIAAFAAQYVHGISSGSRVMRLGAGFQVVTMGISASVANIWSIQEGYLSVQEL